ncbi:GTPase-activating protein [Klebsormidium nitens]|uniref:GTPase-activating protein n=1 Tax=Klebsormidium nitens TaxID=105231 RepID=A0A1Y1I1R5_KLENI|nr:GTPase-activating protein [Klebsormidium nitens]|eukprot:GAQ83379.1 GTPase-activating protein [Klebsormidium nitens]
MASLFCGRPSSSANDGGFMPGEDNISDVIPGETKQLIVIPARRRLRRSKGLTAKAWRKAFDTEGRPTHVAKLLGKVQRGGVNPSIRPEVWELLLGVWPVNSTAEDRRALRSKRRLLYAEVLDQCRQIHPGIGSGKLAYAVNDSRILDARTSTSPGIVSGTVASFPRESEAEGQNDGESKELPRPPRRSLERVRIGSRAANELGWGANFLFAIAERNAKDGLYEAQPALDVWLEWYVDETVAEVGSQTGGGGTTKESVAGTAAEEGTSVREMFDINIEKTREITPEITPELTPGRNIDRVPESVPQQAPEMTCKETCEIAPEITPEVVPEVVPEVTPDLTPAQASEITPATTSGSALTEENIGGRTLERPFHAGAEPAIVVAKGPGNEPLVENGQQENQGSSSLPPKPAGLGRVKTMVAELERRAQDEALEVQASFSKRPKGAKLGKEMAAKSVLSAALLRDGSEGRSLSGPSQKEDMLTSAAGRGESDGVVASSLDGRNGSDGPEQKLAAGAAKGGAVLTSAGEGEAGGAAEDGAAVLTSAAGSSGGEGAELWSAVAPVENKAPVLTTASEKTAGGVLYRGASLDGLAPEPGPLGRSRSAAVILTSAVSVNSDTNPGDDDSVAGYGTPGSHFTTFSTDERFFTPDRSLSAFLTPMSAAYATPDEGFFTPERLARSASASPALSRGSARSVNRLPPRPSDWNARKEGLSVSEGTGSTTLEGQSEAVPVIEPSTADSVSTVKPNVGPSERGGENAGDSQVGGESSEGGSARHELGEGVNSGLLEPVVVRESRPLHSHIPEAGSVSHPQNLEASQIADDSATSSADAPQLSSGKAEQGVNGPKKRGVNGPAELLLVVEDGSSLTALGQGPVHTSAAQPFVSLGWASVTPAGLTIRKTAQGSGIPGQKAPRVVTRNKRRLYGGASGESPERPEGPLNMTPAGFSRAESAEDRLTGPEAEKAAEWLWTLHRIVVDVVRTDRNLEFYDVTSNVARMADILAVYAWLDPEVGYCQGMSDLLSPFVVLFEDDADAFWCFARLMRRMRHNFGMRGPVGVLRQLDRLREIVAATDPTVGEHLRAAEADNFLFAFRILLVMFRRELSFSQVLTLWEMLWAADFDLEKGGAEEALFGGVRDSGLAEGGKEEGGEGGGCEDELCVFCVAAILHHNRTRLRKEVREMDDAVKLFNAMELRVDVRSCVERAIKQRKAFWRKTEKKAKVI